MKPGYRHVPYNPYQLGAGTPTESSTTIRIAVHPIGSRIRPFLVRALDQTASGAGGQLDKRRQ